MIEAATISRMYSQIVQGKSKDESGLVADDEHGAMWDTIAGEVEAKRGEGVVFEVPFDHDEDSIRGPFESMRKTKADAAPADAPPKPEDEPPAENPEGDPDE